MVVKKNIPSLVTIRGEDTAVAYKGQRQTCLHCQEFVHVGIPCVQNKKLLVQKLAADQSYANVAKQSALQQRPARPNKQQQSQLQPTSANEIAAKPKDKRIIPTQQTTMMAPPMPVLAGAQSVLQNMPISTPIGNSTAARKTDGNDTDSSHVSNDSSSNRRLRSRRSPPGKKMRHSDSNEHVRGSGDDNTQ